MQRDEDEEIVKEEKAADIDPLHHASGVGAVAGAAAGAILGAVAGGPPGAVAGGLIGVSLGSAVGSAERESTETKTGHLPPDEVPEAAHGLRSEP